jgi:hypothetical protein
LFLKLSFSFRFKIFLTKLYLRIDNDDENNEYSHDDNDEEAEENEEGHKSKPKKEVKKTAAKKPSKLSVAVASEKNNSSLLNFFQKSQKRTLNEANDSCKEIVSYFFTSRKLKICTSF